MSWRTFVFVASMSVLAHESAAAQRGDVLVDVRVAPEYGWLMHPAVEDADFPMPFQESSFGAFKPRFGVGFRYGVLNWLYVGAAVDVTGSFGLAGRNIKFANTRGDMLVGSYAEFTTPLLVGARLDSGCWYAGAIEFEVAPLVTYWGISALADPKDLDKNGLPHAYPIDVPSGFQLGAMGRVNALFTTRFLDRFLVDVGPTVGASWATTPGLHAGLMLRGAFAIPTPP